MRKGLSRWSCPCFQVLVLVLVFVSNACGSNINQWRYLKFTNSLPSSRIFFSMVPSSSDSIIIFGGAEMNILDENRENYEYSKEVWTYHITTESWEFMSGTGFTPSMGHTALALENGDFLIFGGKAGKDSFLSGASYFNSTKRTTTTLINIDNEKSKPVAKRAFHSTASSDTAKTVYYFGGASCDSAPRCTIPSQNVFNDLHKVVVSNDLKSVEWIKLEPKGDLPSPRVLSSLVATPDGRLILFGGFTPVDGVLTPLDDLWVFDISQTEWTQIKKLPDVDWPAPRAMHTAISIGKESMLVVGGSTSLRFDGSKNDVWYFSINNQKWYNYLQNSEPETTLDGPLPRGAHAISQVDDLIIIYGGKNKRAYTSDVWGFRVGPVAWSPSIMNTPRAMMSAVNLAGFSLLMGGRCGENAMLCAGEAYQIPDESTPFGQWKALSGYPFTIQSASTLREDADGYSTWTFGGRTNTTTSSSLVTIDLIYKCAYICKSQVCEPLCSKVSPSDHEPISRFGHTLSSLSTGLVSFGGADETGTIVNDMWFFTFPNHRWMQSIHSIAPQARMEHCAVVIDSQLFVFGGAVGTRIDRELTPSNELWVFANDNWRQITPRLNSAVPSPRSGHSCVQVVNGILVFGGYGRSGGDLQDLWRYNIESNVWEEISSDISGVKPSPRRYSSMVYDPSTGVTIFGGASYPQDMPNKGTLLNDLFNVMIGSVAHVSPKGSDLSGNGSPSNPYLTIQKAVDSVLYGEVLLTDGIYEGEGNEEIQPNFAISIKSVSGASKTVISCKNRKSAFLLNKDNTPQSGFTLSGVMIVNCEDSAIKVTGSKLVVSHSVITKNTGKNGGGIFISEDSEVTIIESQINDNTAENGGGIYSESSLLITKQVSFVGNKATNVHGGAVYIHEGVLSSIYGELSKNSAIGFGGAFYILDAVVDTMTGLTFSLNTARSGAGVYLSSRSNLRIIESVFSHNSALNSKSDFGGGGLCSSHTLLLYVEKCSFISNNSTLGAGIYSDSTPTNIISTNFTSNNAINGGGIFTSSSANLNLQVGTNRFVKNIAQYGAALYLENTKPASIHSSTIFQNNNASHSGGGIYWINSAPNFEGSPTAAFVHNFAGYGQDLASGAFRLAILSGPTEKTPVILSEPFSFTIGIHDYYDHTITTENDVFIMVQIFNQDVILRGSHIIRVENGVATFSDLTVFGSTDTVCDIVFTSLTPQQLQIKGVITLGKCPVGYGLTEDKRCDFCNPGTYLNSKGLCEKCSPGSYAEGRGNSKCKVCPAGSFNEQEGSTTCRLCDPGYFAPSNSSTCEICFEGTYSNVATMSLGYCVPCTEGYVSNLPGGTECQLCPKGYMSNDGKTECIPCSPGSFSPNPVLGCQKCPAGSVSENPASVECKLCPINQYTSNEGAEKCTPCSVSYYTTVPGSTKCEHCLSSCKAGTYIQKIPQVYCPVCLNCTAGTYSINKDQKKCDLCPQGSINKINGATNCEPCPPGHYTSAPGATHCIPCPANTYAFIPNAHQCEPCPIRSYSVNGTSCRKCPDGTSCVGSNPLDSLPGYWGGAGVFYECFNPKACVGANKCSSGHIGPLCVFCQKGYGRVGSAGLCLKCDVSTLLATWIGGGLIFLVLIFMVLYVVRATRYAQLKGSHMAPRALTTRIFINHLRTMGFLGVFKIGWTAPVQLWLFIVGSVPLLSVANYSIDCVNFLPFYLGFFSKIFLPVLIFLISSCLLLVLFFCKRILCGKIRANRVTPYWTTFNVYVMRLLHPIVAYEVMKLFDCLDFGKVAYLTLDVRERCYDDTHRIVSIVGLIVFSIFCIAVPVIEFIMLLRNRKHLKREAINSHPLSLFFLGYRESCYYWEFIGMVKDTLLVAFIVALRTYTLLQQFYVLAWLFIGFLALHFWSWPYRYTTQNILEAVAVFAQFASLMAGIVFYDQRSALKTHIPSKYADLLFVFLNSSVIILLLGAIIGQAVITWAQKILRKRQASLPKEIPPISETLVDHSQTLSVDGNEEMPEAGKMAGDDISLPLDSNLENIITVIHDEDQSEKNKEKVEIEKPPTDKATKRPPSREPKKKYSKKSGKHNKKYQVSSSSSSGESLLSDNNVSYSTHDSDSDEENNNRKHSKKQKQKVKGKETRKKREIESNAELSIDSDEKDSSVSDIDITKRTRKRNSSRR